MRVCTLKMRLWGLKGRLSTPESKPWTLNQNEAGGQSATTPVGNGRDSQLRMAAVSQGRALAAAEGRGVPRWQQAASLSHTSGRERQAWPSLGRSGSVRKDTMCSCCGEREHRPWDPPCFQGETPAPTSPPTPLTIFQAAAGLLGLRGGDVGEVTVGRPTASLTPHPSSPTPLPPQPPHRHVLASPSGGCWRRWQREARWPRLPPGATTTGY